jgi:hypothetical protein
MKYLWNEIRIISSVAWPIALVCSAALFALMMFVMMPNDSNMSKWPFLGRILVSAWSALFTFISVALIGYINADARRRGMHHVMWTLLAIFVPYGIGIILYFVLRTPLLLLCSKCGATGRSGFIFCPECGAELSLSCPACKRAVGSDWKRCAYCGRELGNRASERSLQV